VNTVGIGGGRGIDAIAEPPGDGCVILWNGLFELLFGTSTTEPEDCIECADATDSGAAAPPEASRKNGLLDSSGFPDVGMLTATGESGVPGDEGGETCTGDGDVVDSTWDGGALTSRAASVGAAGWRGWEAPPALDSYASSSSESVESESESLRLAS